jgi:4,5-DOPA dioxygenase extradiol
MATIGDLKHLSDALPVRDAVMPVLFVGHGSPMNGIEDNEFSRRWQQMGKEIPQPVAVLCISAHWLTNGTFVTAMDNPRTIHDFGGFPPELFAVQYPAPGSVAVAEETKKVITSTDVHLDHDWGLDHGCWSVVKHMYPDANIPVLQLSIDYAQNAAWHYALAKELAVLRRKGVLIMGSGNMVHNLRMVSWGKPESFAYDWAIEANEIFKQKISKAEHKGLIDYHSLGNAIQLSVPTPDHYYPMMYSLGLQEAKDEIVFFNDKPLMGSLSMTSFQLTQQ